MNDAATIKTLAKRLGENEKFDIIRNTREIELHQALQKMLVNMFPKNYVAVTHGADEYGRDLVIIQRRPARRYCHRSNCNTW